MMLQQQQSLPAFPLQLFQFDAHDLHTYEAGQQVWFQAGDICAALGLGNTARALDRLDGDEKGITTGNTLGGQQQILIVNESGLYSLVLTSRKPEARRFKRWITHEVLPAIRKTGGYAQQAQQMALPAPTLSELLGERFTIQFDPGEQYPRLARFPSSAIILNLEDREALRRLMSSAVPSEMLPEMLRLGMERVLSESAVKKPQVH